jgi:DOPA 4,5-dioxygenase
MTDDDAPYHAHIYFEAQERATAEALRREFARFSSQVLFTGAMTAGKAGPHPIPQFEAHFLKKALPEIVELIRRSGLRALVHPLTNDDMADHTSLAQWIGEPVELDLSTLDPPGTNKGVARFGKSDF